MYRFSVILALLLAVSSIACTAAAARPAEPALLVDRSRTGDEGVGTNNRDITIASRVRVPMLVSINGDIRLEQGARAGMVVTNTGDIELGPDAHVGGGGDGMVATTTGNVRMRAGSEIDGPLKVATGAIELDGAHVRGDVGNCHGDITIGAGSRVDGRLLGVGFADTLPADLSGYRDDEDEDPPVCADDSYTDDAGKPVPTIEESAALRRQRIVVGPNAQVRGELVFTHPVDLLVHATASIGRVRGATAHRYDTPIPPPGDTQIANAAPAPLRITAPETTAPIATINQDINIGESIHVQDVASLHGSIIVGDGAYAISIQSGDGEIVLGRASKSTSASTTNGTIRALPKAQIESRVSSANGEIRMESETTAAGVHNVGGRIFIGQGARIIDEDEWDADDSSAIDMDLLDDVVTSADGAIELLGATIVGNVCTQLGDVQVDTGARIIGGIRVARDEPCNDGSDLSDLTLASFLPMLSSDRRPRIIIGPNAVVEGPLVFEREVNLYVHQSARIGKVTGATAVPYSGDRAPAD